MAEIADRIVDSARSRLPGAIDNNIYFEMADVLNEFFRLSHCWREAVRVPVLADRTVYELESIEYPSQVLSFRGLVNADNIPFAATMPTPLALELVRALPAGDYYAWLDLTVGPKSSSENYPTFPEWVADRYGAVIADGIVGRMMGQPAKPYSSPQHALFFSRKFRSGALEARVEADRHNMIGGQAWRFPRFAAQR